MSSSDRAIYASTSDTIDPLRNSFRAPLRPLSRVTMLIEFL